ncbi:deoxyribonuclease gamma isoform X2 [Ahaetulla prasina]|uniref:deoxyribonuclease gamma isoform X2 n=1 Tax=Ahaetulla prasina TaxID=499056 RepID=UPI0026496749|nr:deoxyribonuclease gamma isoform X2 [Ahaetulla prasina]
MLRFFLFLLFFGQVVQSLRICSFNVRSFGESKRKNPEILEVIVEIVYRCDIMLLMEIKDNRNRICPFLLEKLNGVESVCVKQIYQYPDLQPGDEDAFSREPFVVWFNSPKTAVKEFVIIPIHTTPEMAVKEIDELYDVFLDVKLRWKTKNFVFMGDFNAGCGYVAKKQWKNIRLRNYTDFVWIIDDNNDTTVKSTTHCPYDRIVLHGEMLINSTTLGSANIFDFQRALSMTEEQALAVSDHFPVEFQLRTTRRSSGRTARYCRTIVS